VVASNNSSLDTFRHNDTDNPNCKDHPDCKEKHHDEQGAEIKMERTLPITEKYAPIPEKKLA
jgi:hypothetical protein